MDDDDLLELVAPGYKPKALLLLLLLAPFALVTWASAAGSPAGFGQLLATGQGPTDLWVTAGGAIFIFLLWLLLHLAMHRHRLDLDRNRLRVSTSLFTRSVPLAEIQLDKAQVIDLDERTEYRPLLKLNGYALPGFQSGHFRLRSNDSAFVAIVGGPRVLWLPTTSGKGLLLQPQRPEALLRRLVELAEATPRR